jgi:SAM-dependent methyltransferase
MRTLVARVRSRLAAGGGHASASSGYELHEGSPDAPLDGWRDPRTARLQHSAFAPLLEDLRRGAPRADFVALAKAIAETALADPSIVEIGCGSGWNSEVLEVLLGRRVRYVGVDYSTAMTAHGRACYPRHGFVTGDATGLPVRDAAFDIAVSGGSLMHIADYEAAIAECRRVARRWCVFHTVVVLADRNTTVLRKRAYGGWTVEVVFNEAHLLDRFAHHGLRMHRTFDNIPYDLAALLGERTEVKTYLCEVRP